VEDIADYPVAMTFTTTESIDILIQSLEAVRALMKSEPTA
jgi:hypothetical protein